MLAVVATPFAVLAVLVAWFALGKLDALGWPGSLALAMLSFSLLALSARIAFAKPRGATPGQSRRAGQVLWGLGGLGTLAALVFPGDAYHRMMLLGPSLGLLALGAAERKRP